MDKSREFDLYQAVNSNVLPQDSLVYVIILNWNGWRDTAVCLDSLQELHYPNVCTVVVDNGSSDDSEARLRGAYPHVTVLQSGANLGFAGGNNVGIRYALTQGAEYVWLLNNDTYVAPDALDALVARARQTPGVGAVGSALYNAHDDPSAPNQLQTYGGGQLSLVTGISRHITQRRDEATIDYLSAASLLLRREALEQVGLLDDDYFMYWEDTDLSLRLRQHGWQLAVAEDATVWHKESASSGKRSLVLDHLFHESAAKFFCHYAPFPLLPISIAIGGRSLKRLLQGDRARARALWAIYLQALKTHLTKSHHKRSA